MSHNKDFEKAKVGPIIDDMGQPVNVDPRNSK
ncbi:uncharacterized protein G2W53_003224 [Senna tora]|uniref:Uncharacterized protein n=1 Tax=Senna tora TaxID=362788 RepID=A0A835CFK1_9FABA|nr:uncharacterized protein G2W53_003224 [Senna tora]